MAVNATRASAESFDNSRPRQLKISPGANNRFRKNLLSFIITSNLLPT